MKDKLIKIGIKSTEIPLIGKLVYSIGIKIKKALGVIKKFRVEEIELKTTNLARDDIERREAELILSNTENGVFFDVGACKGIYSIAVDKKNPDTDVFAFEPANKNIRSMKRKAKLNNALENIEIIEKCLGDKTGEVTFFKHPNEDGIHCTSKEALQDEVEGNLETQKVSMTTIDRICEEMNVSPSFIKIDVEGAELKVLKGGKNTLKKSMPSLLIEVHKRKLPYFNSSLEDIEQLLDDLNYQTKFIDDMRLLAVPKDNE